jgi:hypothetical protein
MDTKAKLLCSREAHGDFSVLKKKRQKNGKKTAKKLQKTTKNGGKRQQQTTRHERTTSLRLIYRMVSWTIVALMI